MKIKEWINKNLNEDLSSKIILITGANSGIGFEASKILASKGATIILACRNEQRALKAKELILKEYPSSKIDIILYDQSSFSKIDKFEDELRQKYDHIDALVLNAGIYHPSSNQKTEDGLPLTIGVNYFGCFYLVDKLLTYLEKSHSKIIFVTSLTHRLSKYKDYSFLTDDDKHVSKTYGLSKLAIVKLFLYLSNNENIEVLMMHPGVSSTNIFSSTNNNFPKWFQKIAHIFLPLFTHSPLKASLGITLLASKDGFNKTYLGPRGLFGIFGYPKKKKIPNRYKKDVDEFINKTRLIIKSIKNK